MSMVPYFSHVIHVLCENLFLCYGNLESRGVRKIPCLISLHLLLKSRRPATPVNQPCK